MNLSSVMAAAGQATTGTTAAATKGSGFDMLPIIIIVMVLFYILVIMPQKKSQKQTESMRNTIKAGDRVKSIGGIYGTVTAVDTTNDIITVQVDRNVKIDFDRNAIATVTKKEDVKQAREAEKEASK